MTPGSKMRCAPLLPPHPGAARCHGLPWGDGESPAAEGRMERAGQVACAWVFERYFPLTPALSLGARENLTPLGGESDALRRAGVSALNRGAHGAGVVEFIRSSHADGCFERCFTLTPALRAATVSLVE